MRAQTFPYRRHMRERASSVFEKAFTLIELIVVVVVLGILLAIAIPSFFGASKSAQDAAVKTYLTTAATNTRLYAELLHRRQIHSRE